MRLFEKWKVDHQDKQETGKLQMEILMEWSCAMVSFYVLMHQKCENPLNIYVTASPMHL